MSLTISHSEISIAMEDAAASHNPVVLKIDIDARTNAWRLVYEDKQAAASEFEVLWYRSVLDCLSDLEKYADIDDAESWMPLPALAVEFFCARGIFLAGEVPA